MDPRIERIRRRVAALRPQASDAVGVAQSQVVRMKERMANGISLDGTRFTPKKDGTPSTLRKTGRLLAGLTSEVVAGPGGVQVKISVKGPAAAYAPFVNAKRPFMGLTFGERAILSAELRRNLMNRARRA